MPREREGRERGGGPMMIAVAAVGAFCAGGVRVPFDPVLKAPRRGAAEADWRSPVAIMLPGSRFCFSSRARVSAPARPEAVRGRKAGAFSGALRTPFFCCFFGHFRTPLPPALVSSRLDSLTLPTRAPAHAAPPEDYPEELCYPHLRLQAGAEIASFDMGSTVVVVFEALEAAPGAAAAAGGGGFQVKRGDVVKAGQPLWGPAGTP